MWFAKILADCKINRIAAAVSPAFCYNFSHVALCQSLFRNGGSPVSRATKSAYRESRFASTTRRDQAAASRSQLGRLDKLFWVVIRQFWSQWKKALIVVTPETVVRWHQAGFRLYWRAVASATVTANFGSVLIYSVDLFRWGREWLANWAAFF